MGRVVTDLEINVFCYSTLPFFSSYMKFLGAVACSQNHNQLATSTCANSIVKKGSCQECKEIQLSYQFRPLLKIVTSLC